MEIVITQILELETGTDIHTEGGASTREDNRPLPPPFFRLPTYPSVSPRVWHEKRISFWALASVFRLFRSLRKEGKEYGN